MNKQFYLQSKRIFDIMFSIFSLVFLFPIIFIISILIKISSKGPIIFKQIRVGLNGRTFYCYKFRSMIQEANQKKYYDFIHKAIANEYGNGIANNHLEFKKKDDRLTKVGKFIRLTSLDEVPQFYNVIKGDMSIIGPRPDVPESVRYYTDFEKERLKVKPGITGWWQINGRSNLKLSQMFTLDKYYVDNQSFWLDLKIFFKTIIVVLSTKGSG